MITGNIHKQVHTNLTTMRSSKVVEGIQVMHMFNGLNVKVLGGFKI